MRKLAALAAVALSLVAVNVANAGTNHHPGSNGNGHGRSFADGH
jgi:hypothetical protein